MFSQVCSFNRFFSTQLLVFTHTNTDIHLFLGPRDHKFLLSANLRFQSIPSMSHQTPPDFTATSTTSTSSSSFPTFCFLDASFFPSSAIPLVFILFLFIYLLSSGLSFFHSVCRFSRIVFQLQWHSPSLSLLLKLVFLITDHCILFSAFWDTVLPTQLRCHFNVTFSLLFPLIILIFNWTHYYLFTYQPFLSFFEGHLPSLYLVPGGKNETKYLYLYYIWIV